MISYKWAWQVRIAAMDSGSNVRPPGKAEEDDLDVVVDSPAVRKLIEEVRAEDAGVPRSYNRTFNRHNR